MGKYVVSPSTHPTDCGRFRASFSVHRSESKGGYCRVFRFDKVFASREAARLFLRVTSVRAERLLDMTVDDAIAEGINTDGIITSEGPIAYRIWNEMQELWDSTIKPADRERYGWDANPWVWVIEFERCEKPKELCKGASKDER